MATTIPEDLRYTKEHEWARKDDEGVTFGITEHAQEQLGDVVFVELPEVGEEVAKGETFGSVESTKAVSELFAPMTGKVIAINDLLEDNPEAVNEDPYGDGWLLQIEPADEAEWDDLMDPDAYADHVEQSED